MTKRIAVQVEVAGRVFWRVFEVAEGEDLKIPAGHKILQIKGGN